jgi:glycosyltransferase involved in cell wall biosynthesis
MLSVGTSTPPVVLEESGRKVRIGMVLDQPFPPDARVEREATALAEAGYEVHLLCAMRPGDLPEEAYRGVYLHRVDPATVQWKIPYIGLETRLPYQGLIRNYFHHFKCIDTVWYTLIERFAKGYGVDVLHIHDLRLLKTALTVADRLEITVVADLHENYPALMQMMKGRNNPERGEAQRKHWEEVELECTLRAEQVITVTDEAMERLVLKGVPAEKIMVLENTVDMAKFQAAPIDPEITRRFKPDFVLTYVGHLNDTHRGIQTVIEAMAILKYEIPELKFIGAGAIREPYRELLDQLIDEGGLHDRVHFTGWLDEIEFVSYIEASDICLCPHIANDHTNATFPNKVYLYHLFKKPILVSNATPLQRYVESTGGGLAFQSGDADMLANLIRMLYNRPDLRREMANKGQKVVLERYNWAKSARDLIAMYDSLVEEMTEEVSPS